MNRIFILTISILLQSLVVFGQIDSFQVNNYNFKFEVPQGWKLISKANGFCMNSETNAKIEMPQKSKKCNGYITISFYKNADSLRRKPTSADENKDSLNLDHTEFEIELSGYKTVGGYDDSRLDNDTFFYNDSRGYLITTKSKSQNKKWTEIHKYSRWSYLPINDSVEILIHFQGTIPHNQENVADAATINLAKLFYEINSISLDSLQQKIEPETEQPKPNGDKQLHIDSLRLSGNYIKYPIMSGWTYGTPNSKNENQTVFLTLQADSLDSCEIGSIVLSYQTNTTDPLDDFIWLQQYHTEDHLPTVPASGLPSKPQDSLGFTQLKSHYYFSKSNTTTTADAVCSRLPKYSEAFNIMIFTTNTTSIRISILFERSSSNDEKRRKLLNDYTKFISAIISNNNFESFYFSNNPEQK